MGMLVTAEYSDFLFLTQFLHLRSLELFKLRNKNIKMTSLLPPPFFFSICGCPFAFPLLSAFPHLCHTQRCFCALQAHTSIQPRAHSSILRDLKLLQLHAPGSNKSKAECVHPAGTHTSPHRQHVGINTWLDIGECRHAHSVFTQPQTAEMALS